MSSRFIEIDNADQPVTIDTTSIVTVELHSDRVILINHTNTQKETVITFPSIERCKKTYRLLIDILKAKPVSELLNKPTDKQSSDYSSSDRLNIIEAIQ